MKHALYWTPEKIARRLKLLAPLVYRQSAPLADFHYQSLPDVATAHAVAHGIDHSIDNRDSDASATRSIDSALGNPMERLSAGSYWGKWADNFVLRNTFQIPADWGDEHPVALYLPLGEAGDIFSHPEALVLIDGVPYVSADRHHQEIPLQPWQDGKMHTLVLQGWSGLSGWPPDRHSKKQLFMGACAVVQIDQAWRDFFRLASMTLESAQQLAAHAPAYGLMLNALDQAFKVLDSRDPLPSDAFYDSVPAALSVLRQQLKQAGPPSPVKMIAVGHAHIDVAYLWQIEQTRAKTVRTFSNVIQLMKQYPDYHFSQSMPQLYRYLEQDAPELFKAIQQRVKEGRWEIMGGMWIEADCNLSGAEALVRQLLLGRRYFREKFQAEETPVLWLPDVFGFCASLPQLMQQAGMKWFVTNKLNWNQYNQLPAQLFRWRGIDGTEVLAHFLTTPVDVQHLPFPTTYKAELSAKQVMGTWENFLQKEQHQELMIAFGYGDGGGGPSPDLIEQAIALEAMPGMPQVRMGTVRAFFENIEQQKIVQDLPVWQGELYMEGHRGVYTSEAKNKRYNREAEHALHDSEFLAAWDSLQNGQTYPQTALQNAWELLCLNQFHDILPGTSIPEVFTDSGQDYENIRDITISCIQNALDSLQRNFPIQTNWLVCNSISFSRNALLRLPKTAFEDADTQTLYRLDTGEALLTQVTPLSLLIYLETLPPYSLLALGYQWVHTPDNPNPADKSALPNAKPATCLRIYSTDSHIVMENHWLEVQINAHGEISRLYDREQQREVLMPGQSGNQLCLFEDRPLSWDAWDIDIFHTDRPQPWQSLTRMDIVEKGPLRVAIALERHFNNSRLSQQIQLTHHSKRLDFVTEVDWHESHQLLRVAFPVNIQQTRATYDIPWGTLERPTHQNTRWDQAQFEVSAHKWADLSEADYGVALLNNCKYGYAIQDNVMQLSLIKSATMPNPQADQGEHYFTYSLLPHSGDWRHQVDAEAYSLNHPLYAQQHTGTHITANGLADNSALQTLVFSQQPHVIIETIKQAEDGVGLIIRCYESQHKRGMFTLQFSHSLQQVSYCDLLEQNKEPIVLPLNQNNGNRCLNLPIKPYEIISLRCIFS